VVGDCPPGFRVKGGKCEICPTGSYQPITNGESCWNCPRETFADARGSAVCRKCPVNHFTAQIGSTKFTDCVGPKITLVLCERDDRAKCIGMAESEGPIELPKDLKLRSMKVLSGIWQITKVFSSGSDIVTEVEEGFEGEVPDDADYEITTVNPVVNNVFCYTGTGREYRGSYSKTRYNTTCLNWADVNVGDHNSHRPDNHCRGSEYGKRPWCYADGDVDPRQVECSLPKCVWDEECKSDEVGSGYRGTISTTENGYTCQNWNSNTPHIHYYEQDYQQGIGEHNYCRNPTEDQAARPWCYTTNLFKTWDYCSIPTCDNPAARFQFIHYPWSA